MKNLLIYFFDNDLGTEDEYNPRVVLERNNTKKLLTLLSEKEPYFYSCNHLIKKLKISKDEFNHLSTLLQNISAITVKENFLKLNFPFFLSKDIKIIKLVVIKELENKFDLIKNKIKELLPVLENLYPNIPVKLSLYHLLCGKIFDGTIFDYLEKSNLLKQSYPKNDERDYLIIGYQNNFYCNNFNSKLYCSFNHARTNNNSLSSFGNAYGNRFDYFRYFKLRNSHKIYGKFKILHNLLKDNSSEEIINNSIKVIKDIKENNPIDNNIYLKALQKTNYINENKKILVPVFDDHNNKLEIFSNKVFEIFGNEIKQILSSIISKIMKSNIMCVKHEVDKEEIANELWHIVFGLLNNYLIKQKIVEKPKAYFTEGKYLKCVYIEEKL